MARGISTRATNCLTVLALFFAFGIQHIQGHVTSSHIEERVSAVVGGRSGATVTTAGGAVGAGRVAADKTEFTRGKICIGTNGRMSVPSNRDHHYRNLRDRYMNCTYVDGNLEVTWLQDENLDLSFLQYIREVTGYVLISHVDVKKLVLPRLQIIRGRSLFKISVSQESFALMVTLSKMFTLELPALRDVLSGSVGLFNNYNLCHVKTINWSEIISDPKGKDVYVYNFTSPERECPPCDKSCEVGCWGSGPENCQQFSKEHCSPQCYQGRCFGPNPRECCHLFCAGGCTGPKQSDCLACKNFYDDGVCTQECPPMQRYNSITYSWEPNPDGKYAYGATCVKKCPEHLLKDNGACVRNCPPKKKAVNGECVPCDGPCPKSCSGVVDVVHSGNIDSFKGCTVIEGSLMILDQSFKGFLQIYPNYTFGEKYKEMHPDRLEVFSTLKEITGYLNIQGSHEHFKNLSYFRNLEVIGGRVLAENFFASLYIVKTSLTSLGLKSLKKISAGSVAILENKNLCFAQDINWSRIKMSEFKTLLESNKNRTLCEQEGLICDPQCSAEGCWDVGPDQCLSCDNYKLGTRCLQDCSAQPGIYKTGPKICKPCHEECGSTCHGPGADKCDSCKHVKDGPFCVPKCPDTKYQENGECHNCHDNCVNGCVGPNNTIGNYGCNSCERAIINSNMSVEKCLGKDESCPDGYYYEWVGPQDQGELIPLAGKAICRTCHPRCKKCTGYGFHEQVCQECTNYKRGEQCEDECPVDHYADNEAHQCIACDPECRGCHGPGHENCIKCRNYKIFDDDSDFNSTKFSCTAICPTDVPFKIFPPEDDMEPYCSKEPFSSARIGYDRTSTILVSVSVCTISLLFFLACVIYQWHRKTKAKESAVKMTMALTGLEDNEPLRPTNVQPNLAKLRIIKEAELRKGGDLGVGAFGTVFKGVWVPEGENHKIPVAIKILREDTGANTSKEFLEEAYIMASVEHPNLLQLLAVCMTTKMMLITQLMPLGCLLDFVRTNKDRIGSKAFLNWCTQIARGMAYLEEKRLVHRDLAARNVLVQTPSCVKITDFGLAKLLDINEEEYKAAGGKMPIKWLALECIQHRIFTHKSDVWAFGVTVWELLTYGGRPYEQVSARDVPELLEKGERLPQPNICTIDVYMIMIKCWMLDAESRPGFKELADDFAKMARDPGRYLVIPGDRFMRLPQFQNHANQDQKDRVNNLGSGIDGSESTAEGDEYLQPKSRMPIGMTTSTSGGSPPLTPVKTCWPMMSSTSEGSCAPQNQQNMNKELLRCAAANGLDPNNMRNGYGDQLDSCSSRYCSDPLKVVTEGEFGYDPSVNKREAQVGNVKLDLPLDEDDYLMPSPQQAQAITTYVDLIGDSKHSEAPISEANCYGNYPDFLPHMVCQNDIDNPEYLMSQDSQIPTQTLGIPTAAEISMPNMEVCSKVTNSNGNIRYVPQKSMEEESDHEYYNDFDRLQRELQPLRKSETTV